MVMSDFLEIVDPVQTHDLPSLIDKSPDALAVALEPFKELSPVGFSLFFDSRDRCLRFCDQVESPEMADDLWNLSQASCDLIAGWSFAQTQAIKRARLSLVLSVQSNVVLV